MDLNGPIAAIAPCSAYDVGRFEAGLAMVRGRGFEVEVLPGTLDPEFYLAAPDAVRLAHLQQALSEPRFSGVWIIRGGSGMTRLLPHVDWSRVQRRPVIGFSDVTPLLLALHERGLGPAIHGPVLHSLAKTDEASTDRLWRLLAGEFPAPLAGRTWVEGTASGELVGGNLTLLGACAGTDYALQTDGQILFIEDIAEPGYRVDRVLTQLHATGALDGVAGVAVGQFSSCRAGPGWTVEDLLRDRLGALGVPVVGDLPFGHGPRNAPLPLGAHATLSDGQLHLG